MRKTQRQKSSSSSLQNLNLSLFNYSLKLENLIRKNIRKHVKTQKRFMKTVTSCIDLLQTQKIPWKQTAKRNSPKGFSVGLANVRLDPNTESMSDEGSTKEDDRLSRILNLKIRQNETTQLTESEFLYNQLSQEEGSHKEEEPIDFDAYIKNNKLAREINGFDISQLNHKIEEKRTWKKNSIPIQNNTLKNQIKNPQVHWTQEEENQLIRLYEIHGSSWAKIQKYLGTKTREQIQNYGRALIKTGKIKKKEKRSKDQHSSVGRPKKHQEETKYSSERLETTQEFDQSMGFVNDNQLYMNHEYFGSTKPSMIFGLQKMGAPINDQISKNISQQMSQALTVLTKNIANNPPAQSAFTKNMKYIRSIERNGKEPHKNSQSSTNSHDH